MAMLLSMALFVIQSVTHHLLSDMAVKEPAFIALKECWCYYVVYLNVHPMIQGNIDKN